IPRLRHPEPSHKGTLGSSPQDAPDGPHIDPEEHFPGQPPELMAVLGSQRWRHWDDVKAVAVTPAGDIVSVAGGGAACVWAAESGRLRASVPPSRSPIHAVALDAQGQHLFTECEGDISVWDIHRGSRANRMHLRAGSLFCLAPSPDGRTLAAG